MDDEKSRNALRQIRAIARITLLARRMRGIDESDTQQGGATEKQREEDNSATSPGEQAPT